MLPLGIEPRAHGALAIGIFMILCWMIQVLDHGVSGILGCFLFWMFGIVKFDTAFSGFADTSPWFLFGAICFGLMGGKSGLARRLAYLIMRGIGHSYPRLLLGLIVSNFLLTPAWSSWRPSPWDWWRRSGCRAAATSRAGCSSSSSTRRPSSTRC
jgi:DASS family divalent anion:Na+ symporter